MSVFGYTGFLAGPPLIGFVAQATNLRGGLLVVVLTSLTVAALAGGFRASTEPFTKDPGALRYHANASGSDPADPPNPEASEHRSS